jgi:hypothetical protein
MSRICRIRLVLDYYLLRGVNKESVNIVYRGILKDLNYGK